MNWSFESISLLVATCLNLFGVLILLKPTFKDRIKSLIWLTIFLLWVTILNLMNFLAVLFLDVIIFQIAILLFIPMGLSFIRYIDTLLGAQKGSFRFALMAAVCGALLIAGLDKDAYIIEVLHNGDSSVTFIATHSLSIISILLGLIYGVFGFITFWKIMKEAPSNLKKTATLLFLGFFIYSPLVVIIGICIIIIPELLNYGIVFIVQSVGTLIISYVFYKNPRVAYILPFKAYQLIVLNTESGTPLFTHSWENNSQTEDTENISSILISGLINSIGLILDSNLHQGSLEEIKFQNGYLLIQKPLDDPIACLITTSKASLVLRMGLQKFTEAFLSKYSIHFANSSEISLFNSASELVEKYLGFVPLVI